jgi:hypothetical protein
MRVANPAVVPHGSTSPEGDSSRIRNDPVRTRARAQQQSSWNLRLGLWAQRL